VKALGKNSRNPIVIGFLSKKIIFLEPKNMFWKKKILFVEKIFV